MLVAVQSRDRHHAAQVPTQLFDVQESLWAQVSLQFPPRRMEGIGKVGEEERSWRGWADETRYTVQTNLRGWTFKSVSKLYVTFSSHT